MPDFSSRANRPDSVPIHILPKMLSLIIIRTLFSAFFVFILAVIG